MICRPPTAVCFLLIAITAAALVQTAQAQIFSHFSRSGRINEDFSYEGLEIRRGSYVSSRYGGRVYSCKFTGEIVSTASEARRNVTIRFTALNIFDEKLWEASVHIKSLPAFGTHEFSNKITCQENDPYKWKIAVID